MNQKIRQIQTVLRLEERKLTDALTQYSKSKQQYNEIENQHAQLLNYRQEYQAKLNDQSGASMKSQGLQILIQFISHLDCAISDQLQQLELAKKAVAEDFKKYLLFKQKTEGLQHVLDGEVENEKQHLKKQEQKQYDESASKQWYSNRKS